MDQPVSPFLQFGDFIVDVRQRRLLRQRDGEHISLTSKVFDTLLYFVQHPGEVLDKDTLMQAVWPGVIVEENSLSQNVSTLRQVLGETRSENRYIATVPRRGYRFVAEVVPCEAPASLAAGKTHRLAKSRTGRWIALAAGVVIVAVGVATFVLIQTGSPDSGTPAPQGLAVLPFKPLVPAERDESLELGMTESLIARLSAQEGLVIRPLSSVRRFGTPDQDPLVAGRALGVETVLDGSLQRRDQRLRVSARLLRVSDGQQLWADNFDEDLTTIFDVQDAIAGRVSEALLARLSNDAARTRARRDTENSEAYLLYANGRLAWTRFSEASLLQAIDYFEKAIEQDDRYALAYVGLADSYAILAVFGMRAPNEVFPLARRAAEKALAIDPNLAAAHTTLGHIRIQYDLDWKGGMAQYARAIDLDPSYAPAYHYRGIMYATQGQTERALGEFRRAQQLEPLWVAPRAAAGMVLAYAGRYDEAIAQLTQTLALDDRADNARTYLGRAYLHTGRYEQALAEFKRRRAQAPGSYGDVGQALVLSGRREEALAELQRLLKLSKERHVQALDIATIYASLGEKENAMQWLERAYEDRSTNLGFLAQDPSFDALRTDPRFVALLARIGGV
jgi:DNA-binding winged helix-turn-helix (wHTH) protein/TolB-like protein/Tfp pilus assembly protein PilF